MDINNKVVSNEIKGTKIITKDEFKTYLERNGTTLILQRALNDLFKNCAKNNEYNEYPLDYIANYFTKEVSKQEILSLSPRRSKKARINFQ